MSVVAPQTARRWAAVAVGTALILTAPSVTPSFALSLSRLTGGSAGDAALPRPRQLLAAALASTGVQYQGLARTSGGLALPDLPRLDDTAALLGGTTSTRVWWASPDSWRVDVLTTTGEQGLYGTPSGLVTWDYEANELTTVVGTPPVRLPRADDLLPPQAARRLLGGVGPGDRIQALPSRRVAGHEALGLRVVPSDRQSTIARADLWVARGSALPLELDLLDASGAVALSSSFIELSLTPPPATVLQPPAALGAKRQTTNSPDLASAFVRFAGGRLPPGIAGLPSTTPLVTGTATYGTGLVRIVVLRLPGRYTRELLREAGHAGVNVPLTDGQGVLVGAGLLNAVVASGRDSDGDDDRGYLIAGLVQPALVEQAARQLTATPTGAPTR